MPSPISFVAIQSVHFSNSVDGSVFLRMDGSNVTGPGEVGTVSCYRYAPGLLPVPEIGNFEVFELITLPPSGEVLPNGGYAIRSVNFPNAFLSLNGLGLTSSHRNGAGTVNCQYAPSGWYPPGAPSLAPFLALSMIFELLESPNTADPASMEVIQSLQSIVTPQVFLRMAIDASSGVSMVNCQWYPPYVIPSIDGDYEALKIIYL